VREVRLTGGSPSSNVTIVHSADELTAATKPSIAPVEPNRLGIQRDEAGELASFASTIDFAVSDAAIVRAGGVRQVLTGVHREGATVFLYFSSMCAPCSGGDPSSSEAAQDAYDRMATAGTAVVPVAKGARIEVRTCTEGGGCPPCGRGIP
jgi:hypothetical protein